MKWVPICIILFNGWIFFLLPAFQRRNLFFTVPVAEDFAKGGRHSGFVGAATATQPPFARTRFTRGMALGPEECALKFAILAIASSQQD